MYQPQICPTCGSAFSGPHGEVVPLCVCQPGSGRPSKESRVPLVDAILRHLRDVRRALCTAALEVDGLRAENAELRGRLGQRVA